tara:strand:+ start:1156 stop:1317 length:162 start_codon:yes stop_codon:yes gene_type:complete
MCLGVFVSSIRRFLLSQISGIFAYHESNIAVEAVYFLRLLSFVSKAFLKKHFI